MSTVRDIIDAVKHRLPEKTNVYPALNTAVRLMSKRLFYHKASMVQGELSVSISAGDSSGAFPSDYWGLVSKPYLSGDTYELLPIPDKETKLSYTETSVPIYYEIMGQTIHLYPGSASNITIKGDYWKKEPALTQPSDTMPFFELFDDAISEALIVYLGAGAEVANLAPFINQAVDEVVPYIDKAAPIRFVDAADFDSFTNEDW